MPLERLPVEILSVGKWKGREYALADLQAMEKNFYRLHGQLKPPLKFGHSDDQKLTGQKDGDPALGQVAELRVVGDKLIATLSNMPEIVQDAISKGLYTNVSSEVSFGATLDGEDLGPVLTALSLLGADLPAVSNLSGLKAYLSAEAEKVLTALKGAQLETLSYPAPKRVENTMPDKTPLELAQEQIAKLSLELQTKGQLEKDKDAELDKLRKGQREAAFNIQKTELLSWAEGEVKAKRMLPAHREKIDSLLSVQKEDFMAGKIEKLSLSATDMLSLLKDLSTAKLPKTGELALPGSTSELSADADTTDPADELAKKVDEIFKAGNGKVDYQTATKEAYSQNPALFSRYHDSRDHFADLGERELRRSGNAKAAVVN
jgi:hypothetical protein